MQADKKIKVLFVISSLGGGGAERQLVDTLRHLDRSRFEPALCLLKKKGEFLSQIPADVELYDLKKTSKLSVIRLINSLARDVFEQYRPDAVISFLEYANIICLMARRLSKHKPAVIISEHIYPVSCLSYKKGWLIKCTERFLAKKIYPRADAIWAVSESVREGLLEVTRVKRDKLKLIHNKIDISWIKKLSQEPVEETDIFDGAKPVILSCGRLNEQKNFPLLLRAFSRVAKERPARLVILGRGRQKKNLSGLARELGMGDDVYFLGFKQNPYKYMARADIFALTSAWEGFGIVVVEAMACGLPVISTRYPGGSQELIKNGENGLLVPLGDEAALAKGMLALLADKELREKLVASGKSRAAGFDMSRGIKEYEELIIETIKRTSEDK